MKFRGVLLFAFLCCTALLFADAHPVASPASTTPAGTQYASDIATDGTSFLVVWRDHRDATATIHASRFNSSGLQVSDTVLQQHAPPSGEKFYDDDWPKVSGPDRSTSRSGTTARGRRPPRRASGRTAA